MNELTKPHDHRALTPVTFDHAHQLADMDPTWGLYPHLRGEARDRPVVIPPPDDVLGIMEIELRRALVPCKLGEAAAAAAVLIDSFPQKDQTSATYAEQLTVRLAAAPSDLLRKIVNGIVDECLEWRPTPGRVKVAVDRAVAKRAILLAKVEAGRRYWLWQAEKVQHQAEIAAGRKLAASAKRIPSLAGPRPAPAPAPARPPGRPAHLTPAQLAITRARPPAKEPV